MQRGMVITAVILLVTASLAVGALAAHWPFWRRAWVWHEAGSQWPEHLAGPRAVVRGGATPWALAPATAELATTAAAAQTRLLLRHRDGTTEAWVEPGASVDAPVDGRGLSVLVLPLLFDALERRRPGIIDQPVGAWLDAWKQDQRGALTPRALLAHVAGGIERPRFAAMNPFASAAQLASGPDFTQAALALYKPAAPAARQMLPAAAAQLIAAAASSAEGADLASVLERELWSGTAAHDATLVLDHRRGAAAVHCCIEAHATDWLRLGLQLGGNAAAEGWPRAWVTSGRALLVSADGSSALFWAGEGQPPSGLEALLAAP